MTAQHPAHKHPAKPVKSRVPIVNVFDEDDGKEQALQPAHRPVVVEIENIAPEEVTPPQPPITIEQPVIPPAPVEQPAPVVTGTPMAPEPVIPSFFEHDLQGTQPPVVQPVTMPTAPLGGEAASIDIQTFNGVPAQAVVGEIEQAAGGGSDTRKIIGIILVVIAVVILAVAGLFLYAKSLFAPIEIPKNTPTPAPTTQPVVTPAPTPTPEPVASVSAAMKKAVKIDVLNGTKVSGLATKEATVLKKEGYVTGTVGNGKPELAGTISYASESAALAKDIQKILADFTFKLTVDAKAKTIVVTLGEPGK